jgi:hypothetical protein
VRLLCPKLRAEGRFVGQCPKTLHSVHIQAIVLSTFARGLLGVWKSHDFRTKAGQDYWCSCLISTSIRIRQAGCPPEFGISGPSKLPESRVGDHPRRPGASRLPTWFKAAAWEDKTVV